MEESDLLLSTDQNIQKQYINIPAVLSVPGDFSYHDFLIPHNLGSIPSARAWFEPVANHWYPIALVQMQDGATGDFLEVTGVMSLSTTDLILSMLNFTGSTIDVNVIARIYIDA